MFYAVVIGAVITCCLLQWIFRSLKVGDYGDKYVLITGCDTGFGHELAIRLDSLGFYVFAGCLTEDGAKGLADVSSKRLRTLILDVSKEESIETAVAEVEKKIPQDKGLWALVNNAGIGGSWAPLEMCQKKAFKSVFDINVFGMAETTRLCLPLIRKARGRVVNVASAAGRLAFVAGPYTCTKFAVEAYSDVLRRETLSQGIKVAVLEPGVFKTAIVNVERMVDLVREAYDKSSQQVKDFYGPGLIDRYRKRFTDFYENGSSNIHVVVDALTHAVTAKFPKKRYSLGADCRYIFLPLSYFPDWFVDLFISFQVYRGGV